MIRIATACPPDRVARIPNPLDAETVPLVDRAPAGRPWVSPPTPGRRLARRVDIVPKGIDVLRRRLGAAAGRLTRPTRSCCWAPARERAGSGRHPRPPARRRALAQRVRARPRSWSASSRPPTSTCCPRGRRASRWSPCRGHGRRPAGGGDRRAGCARRGGRGARRRRRRGPREDPERPGPGAGPFLRDHDRAAAVGATGRRGASCPTFSLDAVGAQLRTLLVAGDRRRRSPSVIVPTIGRPPELLERCLDRCSPATRRPTRSSWSTRAVERMSTAALVDRGRRSLRRVPCDGTGDGSVDEHRPGCCAPRHGPRHPRRLHVEPDWVGRGRRWPQAHPGGHRHRSGPAPRRARLCALDQDRPASRRTTRGVIRAACSTPPTWWPAGGALEAIGGFDERPGLLVAEDNDLCYRWLAAAGPSATSPSWWCGTTTGAPPTQLVRTHVAYARAQGAFYAKHLHAGDRRVLPMLWWDLRHGVRSTRSSGRCAAPPAGRTPTGRWSGRCSWGWSPAGARRAGSTVRPPSGVPSGVG